MKFKTITLSLAALSMCALTTLTSCGAKAGEKEIDASGIEVVTDSADWVSVVDGKYKLVGTTDDEGKSTLSLTVKLKLTKEFKLENVSVRGWWNLNLKDKNGTDICDLDLDYDSKAKIEKLIRTGKVDDEVLVTFNANFKDKKKDEYTKALSDAVSFNITDANYEIEQGYSSSYSSSSSDDSEEASDEDSESESASSGDTDWDEVLDSYDAYVTKYIALMKKAANGDASALSEYPALMSEAEEIGKKLSSAKGDLTSEQWARYTKILTRMTSAMK